MKGVSLIGMPGSGKSTIGRELAMELAIPFIDLDTVIAQEKHMTHDQILKTDGEEALMELEEQYTLDLKLERRVFAPGGSIIYSAPAMQKLDCETLIVFLDVDVQTLRTRLRGKLETRGIIGLSHKTFEELYDERSSLYRQYAHITICPLQKEMYEIIDEIDAVLSMEK